ncbi:MAG TPA: hypothetical protein V6C81_08345 [Planktothrix sp.]
MIDRNSAEYQKAKQFWDFLIANGRVPYKYRWSGYALEQLLGWLLQVKGIDLTAIKFVDSHHKGTGWIVLDETIKAKHLLQLDPANFRIDDFVTTELREQYERVLEAEEQTLKERSAKLSNRETTMDERFPKVNRHQASDSNRLIAMEDDLANRGKAMLDGIDVLHKYLQLIDEQSIVILHIG